MRSLPLHSHGDDRRAPLCLDQAALLDFHHAASEAEGMTVGTHSHSHAHAAATSCRLPEIGPSAADVLIRTRRRLREQYLGSSRHACLTR